METWFYSGTRMKDGSPITIVAKSEFQVRECLRKGLVPLEDGEKEKKQKTTRARTRTGRKKTTEPVS